MITLNIGAGSDIKAGMVNIDIRPLPGIDRICDARHLPYEDNSVDKIVAMDIIEHFGRLENSSVLAEWFRVLKPGGVLILRTPDLRMITEDYLAGRIDAQEAARRLYGNQGNEFDHHHCIFDGGFLASLLMEKKFQIISMRQTEDRRNLMVRAAKRS